MEDKNPFSDKSAKPTNDQLGEVLGDIAPLWETIKNYLNKKYGTITEDWKFYSPKYGWTLKMLLKKRNLLFFSPRNDYFLISFVFGDKAVAVVEQSDLPQHIIDSLVNARKYMEGRGILIEVRNQDDVEYIKKLIDIKVNN